jgi:hypothetical protein
MTYHEMLAVLSIAQESHVKPEDQGGHNGPLTIHCFLEALADNAKTIGFPPGYLTTQFKSRFSHLVTKGWVRICDDRCGGNHFELSEAGVKQLAEWNEHGCESHTKKAGRKPAAGRDCAAPDVLRAHRSRSSEAA